MKKSYLNVTEIQCDPKNEMRRKEGEGLTQHMCVCRPQKSNEKKSETIQD